MGLAQQSASARVSSGSEVATTPSGRQTLFHTQDHAAGIDPRRHHHADVDDATALPNLLRHRQPHVSRGRPRKLSSCSQMGHLAGDASQPRALIRFHPHALGQRAFSLRRRGSSRPAFPQLGNVQLHAGLPRGCVRRAGRRSGRKPRVHDAVDPQGFPQKVHVSVDAALAHSKRSMLCLTTVVLLGWVVVAIKDDAVVSFWLHRLTLTPLPGTLLRVCREFPRRPEPGCAISGWTDD